MSGHFMSLLIDTPLALLLDESGFGTLRMGPPALGLAFATDTYREREKIEVATNCPGAARCGIGSTQRTRTGSFGRTLALRDRRS